MSCATFTLNYRQQVLLCFWSVSAGLTLVGIIIFSYKLLQVSKVNKRKNVWPMTSLTSCLSFYTCDIYIYIYIYIWKLFAWGVTDRYWIGRHRYLLPLTTLQVVSYFLHSTLKRFMKTIVKVVRIPTLSSSIECLANLVVSYRILVSHHILIAPKCHLYFWEQTFTFTKNNNIKRDRRYPYTIE